MNLKDKILDNICVRLELLRIGYEARLNAQYGCVLYEDKEIELLVENKGKTIIIFNIHVLDELGFVHCTSELDYGITAEGVCYFEDLVLNDN